MASPPGSKRPSQPPSSPPRPPRRVRRQRNQASEEEKAEDKPVFVIKGCPRRHGKDIHQEPAYDHDTPPETSEEAKTRNIPVQDYQEFSRAEKDVLQFSAYDIFLSDNLWCHLSIVGDFAISSVLYKSDPPSQVEALWDFCARRYPNSLPLMLACLLNSPDLPIAAGIYAVNLLHLTLNRIHRQDPSRIDEHVLCRIKHQLYNVIHNHETIPGMLNLSEIVARMFETNR